MTSYKDLINSICSTIHTDFIDFDEPRAATRPPSQASSEFITNKQQGDWAEDVIFRAVNNNSKSIVAVRYGKSDDIVAGDAGFESFYNEYQNELDTIGKRPDILLFKAEDFNKDYGFDISKNCGEEFDQYVKKAIAGIEVRSSSFLIDKYMIEANKIIKENTDNIIALRNKILSEYADLLKQKRPEFIKLLEQLDEISVRTIDFKAPSWKSSAQLQELSSLLSEIKHGLKIIQKRNTLSITPKVEDIKVIHKWVMKYNVPHFYLQVFFDKVYGISFKDILELVANPDLEDDRFTIEQDTKNQNKTTIKIPAQDCTCIAQTVTEPQHHSVRKELNKGRLLFYVKFDGGEAYIDKDNFDSLFSCSL